MPRLAVVLAVTFFASAAFAEDGGGAPAAPAAPAGSGAPATSATTAAPPAEGEGGGEGQGSDDHPTQPVAPPVPGQRQPPPPRQGILMKDGMIRIPGAHFTMGTSDRASPLNERPARSVVVSTFWLDRLELTVGAYHACVERGACAKPTHQQAACTYDAGDPLLPMSCVSWKEAQAYCVSVGKRLPREVEWELGARGTGGARYPWGGATTGCGTANTLAREQTSRSCSGKRPSHVGTHTGGASPFGLLDMSGNVEEWVADWYADSVSELSPRAGSAHVLRGGGWMSAPSQAKATSRNWGSVKEAGPNVGFRCAKDDTPGSE